MLRYQHAVAPGPQSLFFPEERMTNWIVGRVVNGCVFYLIERETPASVLNPAHDHLSRTDVGDFDMRLEASDFV